MYICRNINSIQNKTDGYLPLNGILFQRSIFSLSLSYEIVSSSLNGVTMGGYMPLMSIFKRAVVENCIHNNLARLCVLYLPKPLLCRNVNKVDLLSTPVKTMFKTLSLSATFLYRSTQRTFKALRCPIFQPMAKCPNRNPCIINVVCLCTITHVSDVLHVTALMSASVRTYTDISDVVYKYEYGRVISIQNCRRIMK